MFFAFVLFQYGFYRAHLKLNALRRVFICSDRREEEEQEAHTMKSRLRVFLHVCSLPLPR